MVFVLSSALSEGKGAVFDVLTYVLNININHLLFPYFLGYIDKSFQYLPYWYFVFYNSPQFYSKSFLANICVFLSVLKGIYPSFQLSANGTSDTPNCPAINFLGFIAFKIYFLFRLLFSKEIKSVKIGKLVKDFYIKLTELYGINFG